MSLSMPRPGRTGLITDQDFSYLDQMEDDEEKKNNWLKYLEQEERICTIGLVLLVFVILINLLIDIFI